ncbi:YbhN family protein [Actinomadura sp. 9N407]|uniref:YbhN family protein n=1 Tax=Actinomadura sp. 9N407 TaxID=3375154 RepID=UPI0037B70D83
MTRSLWPWLRTLIAVGILGTLVWWHSTEAFVRALQAVDMESILVALAIGLFTTLCNAQRWCLVARRLGLRLPLGVAVGDYYQALFLNAVLPAGVLGDVHRAVSHGRDSGNVGKGVRAVVLERVAGQAVIIAAGVLVLLTRPALLPDPTTVALVGLGLAIVTALAFRSRRWRRAITAEVRLVRDIWTGMVVLSAAALAGYVALFFVAARTAGSHAPLTDLVPLAVLALLVMGLPVNVGGWGPREAATALAFGAVGLGAAQGLTVAVVYGVLTFVASLPGAGVLLLRPRLRVKEPQVLLERFDQRSQKVPALAGRRQ